MFSAEMDVRQVGTDRWMLLAPLVWHGPDWTITVPAGFVTDFASIPRPLWALWPRSGRWNPSAVLHDYECRVRFRPASEVHARFRQTLAACGVGWLTRQMLAVGVAQFGPQWNTLQLSGFAEPVGVGALTGQPAAYVWADLGPVTDISGHPLAE